MTTPARDLHARRRRGTWAAMLVASALVGVAFTVPLAIGLRFFEGDTSRITVPAYAALRALLSGTGGVLSTTLAQGASILMSFEAHALYPPAWPLLVFDAELAASLTVALHFALAAGGAALLLRTFRARPTTAATAGVVFACLGPTLDLASHGTYVVNAAWLPLGWAGARLALSRSSGAGLALCAASIALAAAGADPQASGVVAALAAVEGARVLIVRRRAAAPAVARLAAATVAGLLVGAALWSPALAEGTLLTRARGIALDEALLFSFGPRTWFATMLPGVLRATPAEGGLLDVLPGYVDAGGLWDPAPYVGPLLVAAALAGCAQRRARVAAVVCGALIVLALGRHAPLYELAWRVVPVFSSFRFPAKLLVPAGLALTVLAALALEAAAHPGRARRRLVTICAPLALALALVTALGGPLLDGAWPAPQIRTLVAAAALAAAPLVACLAVFVVVPRRTTLPVLVGALSVVVAAPMHVRVGAPLSPERSFIVGLASDDAAWPLGVCTDRRLEGVALAVDGAGASYAKSLTERAVALPDFNVLDGAASSVSGSATTRTMAAHRLNDLMIGARPSVARAAGCDVFVVAAHDVVPDADVVPWSEALGIADADVAGGPARVWRLRAPLPRAWIARGAALAVDETAAVAQAVAAPDLAGTIAVVDDPLVRWAGRGPLPQGDDARVANVQRPRGDTIDVELAGTGPAVVAVRTTFRVGWTATQAGRALPVLRAASGFTAAVVDDVTAGPVALRYVAPGVARGVLAGVVGLAILAGALLSLRRRSPRGPATRGRVTR